jgi:adenylate cyclase
MAKLNLKNILGRKKELFLLLSSFPEDFSASVAVKDEEGNLLFGVSFEKPIASFPVLLNDEMVGSVEGDEKALLFSKLLNFLVQKEAEKKKLGSEVLNLYQEINMIFNFSEKLAQTIDAAAICRATLEQASHIVASDQGVIILWDERKDKMEVCFSYGREFFLEGKVNAHLSLLQHDILNGQSGIVSEMPGWLELQIILPEVRSVIYSALKVNHRVMGAVILGRNDEAQYTAADLKLLTTLSLQSSAAVESALLYEKNICEAKEREEAMRLVNEVTGKFVPHEFIGALGHKVLTDVKLGDQVEKIVTVLFTDIRDYTTLSEKMTPDENFKFVCSFNERLGPLIRKHRGFINQFLGDAIMAIFPAGAEDALRAAIDMQRELMELNTQRLSNSLAPIQIGIGMHTGPLIMGITGDKERMDATTISDTVNTASRLESLTKHYKTRIILSDACVEQLNNKDEFQLRYLGLVQLKGKHKAINIFECFSAFTTEEVIKRQSTLPAFQEAIDNYLNRSFSSAVIGFENIANSDPGDETVAFFLSNARKVLEHGMKEENSGVVEMRVK